MKRFSGPAKYRIGDMVNLTPARRPSDADPRSVFFGEYFDDPKGGVVHATKKPPRRFPRQVVHSRPLAIDHPRVACGLRTTGDGPILASCS